MVLRELDVGHPDRSDHMLRLWRTTGDQRPDVPAARVRNGEKSRVRFQVLFGPASLHPYRMGWPAETEDTDDDSAQAKATPGEQLRRTVPPASDDRPATRTGNWYGWRLMGANNRELGRSALSFVSYPLTRRAIKQLQESADRLVRYTLPDPATGRWSWRLDLDDMAVAVSGRWYERDHDSRLAADKFIELTPDSELADGVVTLRDRRGSRTPRISAGGQA